MLRAQIKVRVTPQYGYGWYRCGEKHAMDVPPEFTFEATTLLPGVPFRAVLGQVSEVDHELSGLWVALTQRTSGDHPTYNLSAFREKPTDPFKDRSAITGFASAVPISN
jgi:hypothetical protein